MSPFVWILLSGLLMSVIALVGSVTLLLKPETLERIVKPLVAFAAGWLLGGAFFHMLPAAAQMQDLEHVFVWTMLGFALIFALEQFLHWHHCHRSGAGCRQPLTYLILLGGALHDSSAGSASPACSRSNSAWASRPGWRPPHTRCRRSWAT